MGDWEEGNGAAGDDNDQKRAPKRRSGGWKVKGAFGNVADTSGGGGVAAVADTFGGENERFDPWDQLRLKTVGDVHIEAAGVVLGKRFAPVSAPAPVPIQF
jgi:hypothetical protein